MQFDALACRQRGIYRLAVKVMLEARQAQHARSLFDVLGDLCERDSLHLGQHVRQRARPSHSRRL